MKILWVSHLLPYPPKGGVMQRSYNMLRELGKRNEVDFITLYQKAHHQPFISESLEKGNLEINVFANVLGVYPIRSDYSKKSKLFNILAGLISNEPYISWWLKDSDFLQAIKIAVMNKSYDAYYFDTIGLAQYLKALPDCECVKILNHHNIESQVMYRRSENEKNIFKSLLFLIEAYKRKQYEKKYGLLFNHNIVVSKLDKSRLEGIAGKISCSVVPNGVDLSYFSPVGLEQEDNTIIFIGGLTFYPNIAAVRFFLKKIWNPLKEIIPSVKFYIVGKNPPEDIVNLAKLDSSVVVTGFLDDIRPLMERSAVYVCPITDGGGTKLKVLDALAMGKALVVHPIACEGIEVENNNNVLFATSPQEYVERIVELLSDNAIRKKFGLNGRKLIEKLYSYEKIGLEFHKIIEVVCAREKN